MNLVYACYLTKAFFYQTLTNLAPFGAFERKRGSFSNIYHFIFVLAN